MADNIIIAHSADPDGILSHALLSRAFGAHNVRQHYFVDYPDFKEILEEVAETQDNGLITVADISMNSPFVDEELFTKLKARNQGIDWIDHHPNTRANWDFLNKFCDNIVYSPNKKCAAELVQGFHRNKLDTHYDRMLAEIAGAHDLGENKTTIPWQVGDSIQNVIYSGFDLATLVQDLASEKAWDSDYQLNDDYNRIANNLRNKKTEAYRKLKDNTQKVKLAGRQVAFAYADSFLKDAPYRVMEDPFLDYAIVAFEDKANIILFGREEKEIEERGLEENHAIDFCRSMNGGGRGRGGGFNIGHPITQESYQEDKELIKGKLEEFLINYKK